MGALVKGLQTAMLVKTVAIASTALKTVVHVEYALKNIKMKKTLLVCLLAILSFSSRAQSKQTLADSAFAVHDYNKAFDYYSDIAKTEPNNLKALRRRAFCMMNFEGQELNATRFFNEALKVDPNDPASNYYMGIIFLDAAKEPEKHAGTKSDFKAKSELYLKKAKQYGNPDADAALAQLNGI